MLLKPATYSKPAQRYVNIDNCVIMDFPCNVRANTNTLTIALVNNNFLNNHHPNLEQTPLSAGCFQRVCP